MSISRGGSSFRCCTGSVERREGVWGDLLVHGMAVNLPASSFAANQRAREEGYSDSKVEMRINQCYMGG